MNEAIAAVALGLMCIGTTILTFCCWRLGVELRRSRALTAVLAAANHEAQTFIRERLADVDDTHEPPTKGPHDGTSDTEA